MSNTPLPRLARYLHPGELFSARGAYTVSTILGSGLSVCLWAPRARVAGINHYVQPRGPERDPVNFRFGVCAVPELVCRLRALAGPGHGVEAKLFGGAVLGSRRGLEDLQQENLELAREVLAAVDIPIVAEDVGGTEGRHLVFDFQTGAVLSRRFDVAGEGARGSEL